MAGAPVDTLVDLVDGRVIPVDANNIPADTSGIPFKAFGSSNVPKPRNKLGRWGVVCMSVPLLYTIIRTGY